MSKRKRVKTSRERAASARHEFEAEAGTTVGIVGAALGAVAGPGGAVAGAVLGGITGAALAKMSDHHEQTVAAEDRELERELAESNTSKSQDNG